MSLMRAAMDVETDDLRHEACVRLDGTYGSCRCDGPNTSLET